MYNTKQHRQGMDRELEFVSCTCPVWSPHAPGLCSGHRCENGVVAELKSEVMILISLLPTAQLVGQLLLPMKLFVRLPGSSTWMKCTEEVRQASVLQRQRMTSLKPKAS